MPWESHFYPVFSDEAIDWFDDIDGKCLAKAADQLNKVAKKGKSTIDV